MAEIRLENVGKRFGDMTIIRGLDLKIEDGEFFSFVGPSGCGKSTLLNLVAGLEEVTEGKIFFGDNRVNDLTPQQRDVAMVFQSYALYPHMTVYQNIAFPLTTKKVKKDDIEREVRRVAALLGLDELLFRKPRDLSGGQRQRVALGRAIIRKPSVFLMDEPLSNLDARLRIETRAELRRLHQELKITTVYVTHDQAEAMSLSDRMAVLNRGEVQQVGKPIDVYRSPANIFVAGFIGSPPMNFIRAYVKGKKPFEVDCNGISLSPGIETEPVKDEVVVGMRPEDVNISRGQIPGSIEVTILLIEPAGPFDWVDVNWAGVTVRGSSQPEETLKPGDKAFMNFPVRRTVVFDPESGRRL
jgi:multiple sugar transport system ATP-binding protein